jgi:small subunit ribosomal protein S10
MLTSKIRIRLKAYDCRLLDKSTQEIALTAKKSGAKVIGPIPLPTKITKYTVLRSPFVHKKSREQFEIKVHKRIVDLMNSTSKTVEALMQLDMPAGVDIALKL